ncbi:MAG TPA: class I SAM-dependent methyltransferase [Polyangiaceae bacterium]|nr:class I SAM-dependent methyltransferase [Polyangiaceae bacterium]
MDEGDASFRALSARFWEQQWLWWDRIGTPLRPCPQDVEIFERLVSERCPVSPRALLLGVTPEIASMRWPAGTSLLAVDRSQGMIDNVWPRPALADARAVQGDWHVLEVGDGAFDVIIGDGSFMQQPFPRGYDALARELRRVLAGDGLFVMRSFVRPDQQESVVELLADLEGGTIGSFHVFKWRLLMALQPDTASGVRLSDAWKVFYELFRDPAALAERRGWPLTTVQTIDAYRGVDARYTYPTLGELGDALSPYFSEQARVVSSYELAERCPTQLWSRR